MVKTRNFIKGFMALIYASGVILAAEPQVEREPISLSQILTIEPETLNQMFGIETFFTDKKKPANIKELEIATEAYRVAMEGLLNKKGEGVLGAIGVSLYFGYPASVELIHHIGFGFLGHNFEGIRPEIKKQIRQQFLEACTAHGITQAHEKQLTAHYRNKWNENQKLIEAIEAEQKKLRRWGPFSSLVLKAQEFLVAPEPISPVGGKQTVPSSEKDAQKDIRKRSRSQESTAAPYLKSRQRKVADAEKQPLLQAGETEEFRISNSEQQPSSTSVRQRKPASPTKQPLPATDETRGSLTSEAKKRN
ncbi:hypothetical protein [Candidatus Odyssella acanthamoebae]|uniref:Uncharacterized protein n=1 Tax=Candidatus Odyssella acanthamoebae TaxID=91604 RepID=A0A077AXI4_9PROT|nr:hypothetical protein [Candidatus Paracaedibacter acanthamoebae]AIK96343.1 hypothetical protein ID47_05745 [Candidatus Paracaedibacter acanthamoebae]